MLKLDKLKKTLRISFSLAKANFNLRIEGNYLGIFWYLLSPLALFCVILFVKKSAFGDVQIANYPAYLLIGITGLHFFQQAISNSIDVINSQSTYIKSINNLDPEVLVIAAVIQSVFSHFFELAMVAGFLVYFKISLVGLLFYPILLFFFILMLLGISFLFATISVYVRDLNNIWTIFSQLLFLGTPIFYVAKVGSAVYNINLFNPLFYFLEIFRSLVIYSTPPIFWMSAAMIIVSLIFFSIGLITFNRHKKKFAELV